MFLKSIEIRGFKSFADKTELIFPKGITAIVGPNGSGKSNISDAVRWVLGEQSVKSLRGGKMEDVIFAGTQFRKPVGLAQVSLCLDNSDGQLPIDYSEITISRRLYRSGESEYYINNTLCRLKDIQELFMDTGIGKEGYSIIGQGKIDAILSGKPEERRSLLEEAAGIVKFKTRKEEAEKKLENTNQNLIRITDIISTYEERLEPLKIDNEKALTFLKLSEELKVKESNLLVHFIDDVQNKIVEVKNNINEIQKSINNFIEDKNKFEFKEQNLNEKLEKCDQKIQQSKQEYYNQKSNYQIKESENQLLNEKLKNLYSLIEKNSLEISNIKNKINSLKESENNLEDNLKQYKNQQFYLKSEIEITEKEITQKDKLLNKYNDSVNELKKAESNLLNQISETKNELMFLQNDQLQLEDKLKELKNSCESFINSLKINSNTQSVIEENIDDIDKNIKKYEEELKKNKHEILNINNCILKDEMELKKFNADLNKFEASYQILANLDNQYEGYNKAVKMIMQHIKNGKISDLKSKCFVLGEIIKVKKELETAIEISLGGSVSDIITNDENVAKKLINYLKSNNLGRATFLPLNIIKGKKIYDTDNLKNINGYIGIASSLISYDDKFTNIIEYILGRTIISSNLEAALEIAKKINYKYKIVTLSGDVINPGGALTGGSLNYKSSNILSRKREIKELEIKINDINKHISELNLKIDNNKKIIKKLDEVCLNIKDEIYNQNIEKTKKKAQIDSIITENNRLRKNLDDFKNEIIVIKNKHNNNYEKILNKETILKEIIDKQKFLSKEISELEMNIKNLSNDIFKFKDKHTNLKIKKAQVDEIILSKLSEKERLTKEIDELSEKIKNLSFDKLESEKNIKIYKQNIEDNNNSMKLIKDSLNKLEILFKENEIEKIKIKESIEINTTELERINLILNKKEENIHKYELALAKLETEKNTLYYKLNEEMSMTYAEALSYKEPIENIEEYKKHISKIKKEISSLGTVNVGAIEEYKQIKEKYNFMNSQKEDLIKAKQELIQMIDEMTEKMRNVFSENLQILRKLFNETFQELFKGGSSDLILSEGDELTANIEINVEPPGKKLQNINLMSGGEKVLSAIALLFAILKMKPTPFCILDEIEAALDDANVKRYSEFLKKFSDNIQFIVITHRKGTMEVSNVLYGVTMEEKGVSKIVSVDLNKQAV
ncbi:chromosome segregation protein SMC [Clostridium prolinivorans]|uniref:chromosome segregation protein SMC n=1 Tax=Clostridium prolinivorans TaxID=2769420 RepID=UPI000FDBDB33|nr:chromosome segregation protein SMC [Clostridium prolinivorans]